MPFSMRKHLKKHLYTCSLIATGGVVALLASYSLEMAVTPDGPPLTDGTLARAADDARVFYVEDGAKRWIESLAAFDGQGFSAKDVLVVGDAELARLPDGPPVTPESTIVLPGDEAVLPDLIPLAAQDVHLSTENGKRVLRFSSLFWNAGKGPLELYAYPDKDADASDEYLDTFQHLIYDDGTTRDKIVGRFLWHDPHKHYHYDNFADYSLELLKPTEGNVTIPPAITQKTTFCMRDDVAVNLGLPDSAARKAFASCGKYHQGVSVGWADNYPYTLPDQFIPVDGLPSGVYALWFVVDPLERFLEGSADNNRSVALIDLDAAAGTMTVLATGASYDTSANDYPDGMLLQPEGSDKVYVVAGNTKRWIPTEAAFASYGYAWDDIYVLPAAIVDAIPSTRLVRAAGTSSIYTVNDHGYRRRILTPDALASYGKTSADAVEISQVEMDAYPVTSLIRLAGDNRVFSVEQKRYVGTLSSLSADIDQNGIHEVSEGDFNAYAVDVVASGLDVPWDIVFLPDGDLLVTERPGTLKRLGAHPAVIDLPNVKHEGEGGLMGIALHPNFAANSYVYLYFTAADGTGNRVERFRLEGDALMEDKIIVSGIPSELYHDGGQIAFGPDGMLYVTTGDASNPAIAQSRASLGGKTLRYTADGAIPSDNPFPRSPVWSEGHRNAQGLAWDSIGNLWQTEHGRSGALSGYDELNLVDAGRNYGWPTIQGQESKDGMEVAVMNSGSTVTWAPSGLAYTDGSLYFAGLKGAALYEAVLGPDGTVAAFNTHLEDVYGRLRAVVLGPDGMLYLTTSNRDGRGTPRADDDQILRVHPDFLLQ